MFKAFLLFSISVMGTNCANIIEGPPSGNAACGGELQWRKFHSLVFGQPCRGYWRKSNYQADVMTAGTFDEDYKCHFIVNEGGKGGAKVDSKELPTELGKYGRFDVIIQKQLCNVAWEKSKQNIPSNAVQAGNLVSGGVPQFVGRKFIDETNTYRYGKIYSAAASTLYFPNKPPTPGTSSDFDVLVCND